MQPEPSNLLQNYLRKANAYLAAVEQRNSYTPDPENHKLDRKHGLLKNFMRLTNKTLIGVNRNRINRAAIFSGGMGLLLGYLCSEADDLATQILKNYRPTIKELLIKEVLRNNNIKLQLNQALLQNVYTNPDIQYNLSEVLILKAILPQQPDLFLLSKKAIIEALTSQELVASASKAAAKALLDNRQTIGRLALQFLGSPTMDKIIREEISSLLRREQINEQIVSQLKKALKQDLTTDGTMEAIYSGIREKFISW